jgi:ankyrin repeat protein
MSATLFDLIERDECAGLRRLLAVNPQLADAVHERSGLGAITFALYHQRFESAKILGAARTQLSWAEACGLGELARLELLLEQDPSLVHAHTADGFTPLHLCCYFRRAPLVIVLLAHGAEVNAVALNPTLLQPLHSAVASRDLATVMAVLAAKPEINARQIRGFVALHSAALSGDVLIVRALLDVGADASLQADDGKRALDFARERGHGALESLLA